VGALRAGSIRRNQGVIDRIGSEAAERPFRPHRLLDPHAEGGSVKIRAGSVTVVLGSRPFMPGGGGPVQDGVAPSTVITVSSLMQMSAPDSVTF
jgi:hypothetical protein